MKTLKPSKKRGQIKTKTLEVVFKEINRNCVRIKNEDRKCNNAILYTVLGELLEEMKKHSDLFRNMKPKLEYMGSYFEGLRVGQPTEYDINVILKLPIDYTKIKLKATTYDCTSIIMPSEFRRLCKTPVMIGKGFSNTQLWCDAKFRLSVKKFRSWMQSVVDAVLADLPLINGRRILTVHGESYEIYAKLSGPANTLSIIKRHHENNVIDVDLVPTFTFELPKKPVGSVVLFENINGLDKTHLKRYFAVPKPSENDFSWRLAFPFQERHLMSNKNNFKSALKLIKLLRDTQDFKQLASYYIKTVFLWEIRSKSDDFWKENSLSLLVVYMMKRLRDCLAVGEIKNFWCPNYNLIKDKIKIETCQNWSNRLSVIISEIEHKDKYCPYNVYNFFNKK